MMTTRMLLASLGLCATASAQAVPTIEAVGANLVLSANDVTFEIGRGGGDSASISSIVASASTLEGNLARATTATETRFLDAEGRLTAVENDGDARRIADLESALASQVSTAAAAATAAAATMAAMAQNVSTLTARLNNLTNTPPLPNVPIRSCRDAIERNPRAPSGVTTVQPEGFDEGFQVYCEHDLYGGGWTLVEKVVAGPSSAWAAAGVTTEDQFFDLVLDPAADTNPAQLLTRSLSGAPFVASLSRAKTNAIARYSDEVDDAISAVVRIDMESNVANPGVQGVYVMSKNGDTTQFDYWAAMRDGRVWGDLDLSPDGVHVSSFGTSFSLAKDPSSFNPARNTFAHATCGDSTYGNWDSNERSVNGETIAFSRHGGLLNDGYCGTGQLWLYTLTPTEQRFLNDSWRRSNVYIR